MDQELADAAAYAPDRRFVCTHQMAARFYMKWRHGRHLERMTSYNLTPSINAYWFEEQSCWISFRSDLKRWSLWLFWRRAS